MYPLGEGGIISLLCKWIPGLAFSCISALGFSFFLPASAGITVNEGNFLSCESWYFIILRGTIQ